MSSFYCVDCSEDTDKLDEYYMVHNDLWPIGRNSGMLCIGCLERRIGRKLTTEDFPFLPINHPSFFNQSDRLKNRLNSTKQFTEEYDNSIIQYINSVSKTQLKTQ